MSFKGHGAFMRDLRYDDLVWKGLEWKPGLLLWVKATHWGYTKPTAWSETDGRPVFRGSNVLFVEIDISTRRLRCVTPVGVLWLDPEYLSKVDP